MKIFAVYLRSTLTSKPEWFDAVRNEYSSNNILHITLVQPRYIEDSQIQEVKDLVSTTLQNFIIRAEDKKLVFAKTEIEADTDNKYLMMSFIRENKFITDLQKSLADALNKFSNYCDGHTKEYELNFRPHLTIADRIDAQHIDSVSSLIGAGVLIEGNLQDLVLAIVKEQTVAESENSNNWTIFKI